jgi:hypothetical protein
MWWIRLAVHDPGGSSRLRILAPGARIEDCKPSQSIDFTEILAGTVAVDLGRSLLAWSDLLDGMSIALLSSEAIR